MMDFLELSHILRMNFVVAPIADPPCYRRVHVPIERLKDLLLGRVHVELPEDCTIYGVGVSEDHYGIYLIMYSEEWEPIPEGCQIPEHITVWCSPIPA